jgi:hypothetical protein
MKEISLNSHKYPGMVVLVDDDDYGLVSQYSWCVRFKPTTFYAVTNSKGGRKYRKSILMHRLILSLEHGDARQIDHADGNGLNNQKSNLRFATHAENQWNRRPRLGVTSHFKGVSWYPSKKRWKAMIQANGKRIYLGLFKNEEGAAHAYNEAALKYHGEFAWLNNELSGNSE